MDEREREKERQRWIRERERGVNKREMHVRLITFYERRNPLFEEETERERERVNKHVYLYENSILVLIKFQEYISLLWNIHFLTWIKKHVKENEICSLWKWFMTHEFNQINS